MGCSVSASVDRVGQHELVERYPQRRVSGLLRQRRRVRGGRLQFRRQLLLAAPQRGQLERRLRPAQHEPVSH